MPAQFTLMNGQHTIRCNSYRVSTLTIVLATLYFLDLVASVHTHDVQQQRATGKGQGQVQTNEGIYNLAVDAILLC